MEKLLVIIPAFNEERYIGEVIKNIPRNIFGVSAVEVLVVDDGSLDNTAKIAQSLGAQVIKNYINRGLGFTFEKGLQYAIDNDFHSMVTIDADGQFDSRDIPKLVKPILNNEAEVVTASRFIARSVHPKIPFMKLIGNKFFSYFLSKLTGNKFYDVSCGFRAYSREAMLLLNIQGEFNFSQEAFLSLALKKMRIIELPVEVKYFTDRRSKVAANLVFYGFNTIKIILRTYRDYKPLKFFISISFISFIIGLSFIGILLHTFFTRGTFYPNIWSGFVGGAFLFNSVIFFAISILADMNSRIRMNQEKILYYLRRK